MKLKLKFNSLNFLTFWIKTFYQKLFFGRRISSAWICGISKLWNFFIWWNFWKNLSFGVRSWSYLPHFKFNSTHPSHKLFDSRFKLNLNFKLNFTIANQLLLRSEKAPETSDFTIATWSRSVTTRLRDPLDWNSQISLDSSFRLVLTTITRNIRATGFCIIG